MTTVEQKRAAVAGAYSGAAWKEKVLKMSEAQVIAIYKRLQAQKKI